ncbi:hypothetical protein EVAR_90170_1 [Eumeta japonica]|uniref:Uncharacterized protein n=1 Tax=Eumeta variegata TaxID=151549 RepID=A0A4C1WYG2_EUMVA|nr:hypothetical protein EVAR_90170_1 [Eumeta japonica]
MARLYNDLTTDADASADSDVFDCRPTAFEGSTRYVRRNIWWEPYPLDIFMFGIEKLGPYLAQVGRMRVEDVHTDASTVSWNDTFQCGL